MAKTKRLPTPRDPLGPAFLKRRQVDKDIWVSKDGREYVRVEGKFLVPLQKPDDEGLSLRWLLPAVIKALELTTRQFAEKTGISYRESCRLVRGANTMIRLKTVESICQGLGIQPGQIFTVDKRTDPTLA